MSEIDISEIKRREPLSSVFSMLGAGGYPVFSVAISAGMADSWTPTEQVQKEVLGKLDDIARLAGWDLAEGHSCLDVVQNTVMALEDLHFFNAGRGSSTDEDGVHHCDAAIMGGPHIKKGDAVRYGGVVGLKETKNPIKAARAMLESNSYGVLTGSTGDEFASQSGCEKVGNNYFDASNIEGNWQSCTSIQSRASCERPEFFEGVGVVVMDSFGQLAAGVSTGRKNNKGKEKLGDSSEILVGLMVDGSSAVVCNGAVDELLSHGIASKVCASNEYCSIEESVTQSLLIMAQHDCQPSSIIAVDCTGQMSIQTSGRILLAATCSSFATSEVRIYGNSIPVIPSHIFKRDEYVTAGLTRYPVCAGHTIATLHGCDRIADLKLSEFLFVMETVWGIAKSLSAALEVTYIGLASDGSGSISILPFHARDSTWVSESYEPVANFSFLGYLTSRKGPELDFTLPGMIRKRIAIKYPMVEFSCLNNDFKGKDTDTSYYAQIIRGQVPHHRIWEDEDHVAFLDRCGSSIGTTVLVSRTRTEGDIFSMEVLEYLDIMIAAHTVAQILKATLMIDKVGIFFEGFEQEYANIRLVPIIDMKEGNYTLKEMGMAPFYDRHPGYLTTQLGPRVPEFETLNRLVKELEATDINGSVRKTKRPESMRKVRSTENLEDDFELMEAPKGQDLLARLSIVGGVARC